MGLSYQLAVQMIKAVLSNRSGTHDKDPGGSSSSGSARGTGDKVVNIPALLHSHFMGPSRNR